MGKSSRRAAAVRTVLEDGEIPVVGMRQPCPCGSGKRYKQCHGGAVKVASGALITRPFAGLRGECDWVAMREIVPAATATARTNAAHGGHDVIVSTVLPVAWPALHRGDGEIMLGLQTNARSSDPSRDVAHALLAAIQADAGTPITESVAPGTSPRLQDVLDPDVAFTVTIQPGFDYWLAAGVERTDDVTSSLEQANASVVPTARLSSVEAAYWAAIGDRRHLRWVMPHEEEPLLDAFARLHAADALALMDGSRYIGSFRADGLVVPVWDLPLDAEAQDCETPAAEFAARLADTLSVSTPLSSEERVARAGVVARQLTLR